MSVIVYIDHRRYMEAIVGRVQLALNVTDVDKAVEFYSRVFDAEPAKRRDGYANFALDNPPLKLVLIQAAEGGTLNHLGVEVPTTGEVAEAAERLSAAGLVTFEEDNVECCYARQDKVWVHDPDGAPWEVYTVLADAPEAKLATEGESSCCTSAEVEGAASVACC